MATAFYFVLDIPPGEKNKKQKKQSNTQNKQKTRWNKLYTSWPGCYTHWQAWKQVNFEAVLSKELLFLFFPQMKALELL